MPENVSSYLMHCLLCGSMQRLQMYPHRVNGEMVGWIFICNFHEEHEIPETLQFPPRDEHA